MLWFQLTKNERRVLCLLLGQQTPLTVADIAHMTQLSKRTVYYALGSLRRLLSLLQQKPLQESANEYLLNDAQRKSLQQYLAAEAPVPDKQYRISYLICAAICQDSPLRLNALIEMFRISRNAVFADLSEAREILTQYKLELVNTKKDGYRIKGDPLLIRTVFQLHMTNLLDNTGGMPLGLFDQSLVETYLEKMKRLMKTLNLPVEQGNHSLEMVYLLLMIQKQPATHTIQIMDQEFLAQTKEYQLVQEAFSGLRPQEQCYLAICLINLGGESEMKASLAEDMALYDCAMQLTSLFELIACVSFDKKEELAHAIYLHMQLSGYKYRNMFPNINPLLSEIIVGYPELYAMTKSCCERLQDSFPYPVDENEIAYLTMHFGAGVHKAKKCAKKACVLITCPSITTSAHLLQVEVEREFDNIVVKSLVRPQEINAYADADIDFVISTVNLDCRYPLIKVHPILTETDKANIATLMMLLNIETNTDSIQLKILLGIIRQNVNHETYQKITSELNHYLNTGGTLVNVPTPPKKTLHNALSVGGIRFVQTAAENWEQEIWCTAAPLLRMGRIQEGYIAKMIELCNTHGTYFVISDDIAIAHARPEDGAEELGISLSIYPNGLTIKTKRNIRFLFVLSTPNQREHLGILENIMLLANDSAARDALAAAHTQEAALEVLKQYH